MSAVAEILAELSRRGVEVRADRETIKLKPRAALDDPLLDLVKAHKGEILAALSTNRRVGQTPSEPNSQNWPPASVEAERRFGKPHAKLFPFLGRKVRTPAGPGTLLQVFADRVTVVLDSELERCSFFQPSQIEPISWESTE